MPLLGSLFVVLLLRASVATPDTPELTFEKLYQFGKNAYTAGEWSDCVGFMLRANDDFSYFVGENDWCREKCERLVRRTELETSEKRAQFGEIYAMHANAQRALCLLRCKDERFTSLRPPIEDSSVFEQFLSRRPFQYLQYCYWKLGNLQSAVRSSFTYLVANPKDRDALDNLAFYMEQEGYKQEMLVDALQMPYEEKYMKGVAAYNDEDWFTCVHELETSMEEFFKEEERCRRMCEDKLNWETLAGVNPEVSIVLTSVYVSVLRCKTDCAKKLSKVNGYEIRNILSSFFDYLHVCYYKLNRGRDACQSIANALLLDPHSPIMRRNKFFYSRTYEKDDLFQPTQAIVDFHKRATVERTFLSFVDERFKYVGGELPPERIEDRMPLDVNVPLEDSFDYSQLGKEVLNEKECAAIALVGMFRKRALPQALAVEELRARLEQRYEVRLRTEYVSCSPNKPPTRCKRDALIVSTDSARCGAFLSHVEQKGCCAVFCVA